MLCAQAPRLGIVSHLGKKYTGQPASSNSRWPYQTVIIPCRPKNKTALPSHSRKALAGEANQSLLLQLAKSSDAWDQAKYVGICPLSESMSRESHSCVYTHAQIERRSLIMGLCSTNCFLFQPPSAAWLQIREFLQISKVVSMTHHQNKYLGALRRLRRSR